MARRCGKRQSRFFTRDQATQIIEAAREPFKTLLTMAWSTGMWAGELLALTMDDLDFNHKTIRVNKAADDNTREIRQPKTKKSPRAASDAISLGREAARLRHATLDAEPTGHSVSSAAKASMLTVA